MERRFCRKCLLREMPSQQALMEIIRDRIAAMPEEQRAGEETAARRLAVCKACEHLVSGTCTLCGCYVELRVFKAVQRCPDVPGRW